MHTHFWSSGSKCVVYMGYAPSISVPVSLVPHCSYLFSLTRWLCWRLIAYSWCCKTSSMKGKWPLFYYPWCQLLCSIIIMLAGLTCHCFAKRPCWHPGSPRITSDVPGQTRTTTDLHGSYTVHMPDHPGCDPCWSGTYMGLGLKCQNLPCIYFDGFHSFIYIYIVERFPKFVYIKFL